MSQMVALGREYLQKWPAIATYLKERPELSGWLLLDDQLPRSLVITAPDRIHYLYTEEGSRRGGYASELIGRLLSSNIVTHTVRVCIAKADIPTLGVFLKADFQIVGFRVGDSIPTYVLEYVKPLLIASHRDQHCLDNACQDLLDKVHVVDALPIYL